MTKPINIVCSKCGSEDVRRDAWAEWDAHTQQWTLGTVFDAGHCEKCEGEASLEEVEYTGPVYIVQTPPNGYYALAMAGLMQKSTLSNMEAALQQMPNNHERLFVALAAAEAAVAMAAALLNHIRGDTTPDNLSGCMASAAICAYVANRILSQQSETENANDETISPTAR